MDILTLSHVTKKFGSQQVLKDVSFSVPEHKIFGFIGKNGAGKTTTMKIILGLLSIDQGEILVNGTPVHYGRSVGCEIGYLPDVPEFYSFFTPAEYLNFCGEISGMAAADRKERTDRLLTLTGLSGESRRINGFSRGMKQRLGIAAALMNRPKLLICDEPTSALDPEGRKEILDILVTAKEQTTILFSTHILSDVERICDEIAFLHHGTIALQGTLDEVKGMHKTSGISIEGVSPQDRALLLSVFSFGLPVNSTLLHFAGSDSQVAEVLTFIAAHQIPFQKIESLEPTLEELFMEVTHQ